MLVDDVTCQECGQVCILDQVRQFPVFKSGVDGHYPGSDQSSPEHHFNKVDAVGHEDADGITSSYAQPKKGPSSLDGGLQEALKRPPVILDHDGFLGTMFLG